MLVHAIPQAVWQPSCTPSLNALPKAGKLNCSLRMRLVDSGPNGGPIGGLDVNSSDDAATLRFAPTWFTCTRLLIGRGDGRRG